MALSIVALSSTGFTAPSFDTMATVQPTMKIQMTSIDGLKDLAKSQARGQPDLHCSTAARLH